MKPLAPKKLSPPLTPQVLPPSAGSDVVAVREVLRREKAPLITRFVADTKALADGTLRVGPKHTWHAIKQKPGQYALLLAGVGALGAGCMAAGINPEPYTIGLSALVCGWSAWKAMPELRASQGPDRLRLLGAHVIFPGALAGATTTAGLLLGHSGHVAAVSAADIAKAGAQSAVIGSDVPTIVQTVLDQPDGAREQKRFRKWLLRKQEHKGLL